MLKTVGQAGLLLSLAVVFHLPASLPLFRQDNLRSEAENFCAGVSDREDAVGLSYTQALACLFLDRPDKAEPLFQGLVEEIGEKPSLRLLFGLGFKMTEHWQMASDQFNRAIALDPLCPKTHFYLGVTLLRWKGVSASDLVTQHLQVELERDPNQYLPNFYLGLVSALDRNDDQAVTYLRKAIELEPSNPDPFLYLGQALARLDLTDEAVGALRESISLTVDPARNNYQVSNAEYVLGQLLLRTGDREAAIRHIRKSQSLKRLQFDAAQADFQMRKGTGIAAPPSGMASHDFRDLRDVEPGLSLVESASENQPQQVFKDLAAQAFRVTASVAFEQKDFESAVAYLEVAVTLSPERPALFFELSQAYSQAGRDKEAGEAFARYRKLEH